MRLPIPPVTNLNRAGMGLSRTFPPLRKYMNSSLLTLPVRSPSSLQAKLFTCCQRRAAFICSRWRVLAAISLFGLGGGFTPRASAQSILAERYNDARTGANLAETQLTTSNVNVSQFGKLFSQTISGSTQAQILYMPGVAIPGKGTHNVVFVATMNDVLYAFDADSNTGANASPLWVHDFTNSAAGITPVPIADIVGSNSLNIVGNVGIESTPVIDPSSNTMYLVTRTKENGSYFQRLHAVAIETGADLPGSPVTIQGSVGSVTFDPKIHNQRSSLALANGKVFIAWASHEDKNAYHGWVMAYDATTLARVGIFTPSPTGTAGGIWMGGWAPAVDGSGNVFYIVGNGSWNGTTQFGESFLRFATTSGLTLSDWFTPDNFASLNSGDIDLGSCGAMLIPRTTLVIGGGKGSIFYLLHADNLGHEQSGNGQAVQLLHLNAGQIKGGPVYWDRTTTPGPWMYVWAEGDFLKAFHFNGTTFDTTPASTGTISAPSGNSPGVLALSASGTTAGSGIVWASIPINQNADHGVVNGMLRAFDAGDLTKELWNSQQNSSRDSTGTWPKFSAPLVINGKVYVGSFSNKISVYGLLPTTPTFSFEAENLTYTPTGAAASVQNDTNSSNGHWVQLTATVAGPTIDYAIPSLAAGTYQVQMEWKGNTSRGILNLKVDGTQVGGTLDQYSAAQTYPTTTFGTVTFSSTGTHTVRLTTIGKNSASSNFYLSADRFIFTSQTPQVAAPTFSPGAGTYTTAQSITINTITPGASIRYTLDGSTPSETAGTLYTGSFTIGATTTIKAIAYETGFTDSPVTTALYTINSTLPTFNFEAESLTYTPTGAAASVQTDANSSGGQWIELAAAAAGPTIDYAIPSVPAGTYQIRMEWKGNNNRGILNLKVDGGQVGGTLDQYSSTQSYPTTTFGTVTFGTAGTHTIRLTATAKNASSSSFILSADKFTLVGQ
jgi:hypothetical protein